VGEIRIQRDERNHVTGLTVRDVDGNTPAGAGTSLLLKATTTSLVDYLHVPVQSTVSDGDIISVDRCDAHLDREIDAILETLVIGLKLLESEHPNDLSIEEATVAVEV